MRHILRSALLGLLLCLFGSAVCLAAAPAAKEETVQSKEAMEKAKKLADSVLPASASNAEAKEMLAREKEKSQGKAVLPVSESVTPKASSSGKKVIYGDIIIHK